MKKTVLFLFAFLLIYVMVFTGCTAQKDDLPTKSDDTVTENIILAEESLDKIVQAKPEWGPDNILPKGCAEATVLNLTDDSYVFSSPNNMISITDAKAFYQNYTQDKSNVQEQESNDYYTVSWTENNVDVYVKCVKVNENKTTITVDFYNGSTNS